MGKPRLIHYALPFTAITGLIGGYSIGRDRQGDAFDAVFNRQAGQYLERAETSPPPHTLIIGDSITGAIAIDCGTVFNASIPGATSNNWGKVAPDLIAKLRPKVLIISLGANDTDGQTAGRVNRILSGIDVPALYIPPAEKPSLHITNAARIAPITASHLMADNAHPNAKGRAVLGQRISEQCKKVR